VRAGSFFSELRRRRVWRVAGAYVLVVWMGVEIVLETFPLFGFPDWAARGVVVLAFLGFPVTLLLAWVFDITPEGVVRTGPAEDRRTPDAPGTSLPGPVDATQVVLDARPTRLAGVFGAGILVALVGFGAYSVINPGIRIQPASVQAVAVLPFSDLSATGDQGYFADGVAEELINRLGRLGDLRVAARTSSFAFRDRNPGLGEVADELGVDAVVEGSVRRAGDQLRVTVELVDVETGFQIWSETYERTVDDIFAIQDEIAAAIASALRLQLSPGASALRAGTENVRAHDAYLLGVARWHARTEADLRRALEYFEEALAEDAAYAPAYAGLALTYAVLPAYSDVPVDEAAERGSEAAARALALDAQNAEAHAAIGQIGQGLEWNLEAAEIAYQRAIEAQPSYATAHQWYAEALTVMGRLEEARLEIERALAIDPLSATSREVLAYVQTVRRDFSAARLTYTRLARELPRYRPGQVGLFRLCLAADCPDIAETAATAGFADDIADVMVAVARADADPSRRAAALERLATLDDRLRPAELALYHAALDDRDGALDRIERAYEEGVDPRLPTLLVHPLFDSLRREPRFTAVAAALAVEAPLAGTAIR
jgi:TolB-like protein/Tfp pilus assembly protein PilF